MKKIYISADIEGIWGNSNSKYTIPGSALYEEYRNNMIDEVNLVIDILRENHIHDILVNDGHGNMDNLLPSKLNTYANFVTSNGAYKEFGMMEGLDETFDGVFFIGYHTRSNTPGVMAHTIWGSMICSIKLDGKEVGEMGINACLAHSMNVPIYLVSGDDQLEKQLLEEIEYPTYFVQTKKAINNQCAICCSWESLKERYKKAIKLTIEKPKKFTYTKNHVMDITFHHSRNADFVARLEEVERIDECTVRISKEDFKDLYRLMRFVIKVCNAWA